MFMDMRKFKFMCLQAYCANELILAKESEVQIECLEEKDRTPSDDALQTILDRIIAEGNTVENVKQLAGRFSPIADYYNIIVNTVGKHFNVGDKYIPSFLILSMLQEYTLRGHKAFADIDFTHILAFYEKKGNEVARHYRCAADVVDKLESLKAVKKRRKAYK